MNFVPTSEPLATRQRMPRASRERQMIAVAEEVFGACGYQAASMDQIAERVGVSKPMLYEYFGSKEGLLIGCLRQIRAELRAATEEAARQAVDAEDALRRGLRAFFDFAVTHANSWRLLRHEAALHGGAAAEIEAIRGQQTALIVELMGAFVPVADPAVGLEMQAIAEGIAGASERLALWWEGRPDLTPEYLTECLMRMVWTGLDRRFTEVR